MDPIRLIPCGIVVTFTFIGISSCDNGGLTGPDPLLCQLSEPPRIFFTFVPPLGSFRDVEGLASLINAPCDTQSLRVALYIHVPGFRPDFICKPTEAMPLTPINESGGWRADYTTGGRDEEATQLIAFLVSSNFSGPCFTNVLPALDDDRVFASVIVNRTNN